MPTLRRDKKFLQNWVRRQRTAGLSDSQTSALTSLNPNWSEGLEQRWVCKSEAVAAFLHDRGRFPHSSSEDHDERPLGIWLVAQRAHEELPAPRRQHLDEKMPGWDDAAFQSWDDRLAETSRIVDSLGRLPKSTDSGDAVSAYSWLRKHLKWPIEHPRRIVLDSRFPGWDATRDDLWGQKLALAIEYFADNGRMPSQYEKSCGTWLSVQKRRATTVRRAELDRRLPGWDKTPEDKWTDALSFVAGYHANHGRLPSSTSNDPEIKYHGEWILDQRKARSADLARAARLDAAIPGWRGRERR